MFNPSTILNNSTVPTVPSERRCQIPSRMASLRIGFNFDQATHRQEATLHQEVWGRESRADLSCNERRGSKGRDRVRFRRNDRIDHRFAPIDRIREKTQQTGRDGRRTLP